MLVAFDNNSETKAPNSRRNVIDMITQEIAVSRVMILGTGDFAVEVADLIMDTPGLKLDGFVENRDRSRCEKQLLNLPVFWINDIVDLIATHRMVCAIGSTKRNEFVTQATQLGCQFATVIHPSARVSKLSTIGNGSIIGPGVQIAAETSIGQHVIINRGALIGHHIKIDDYVTISPGANIGGRTRIGRQAYIAMSAVVLNDIQIGAQSIVGAGSVVTKDVPENVQVVGAPARVTKSIDEPR